MRPVLRGVCALGLLAVGYICGATGVLSPDSARAQIDSGSALSDETTKRITATIDQIETVLTVLSQQNRYNPATKGVNSFAATVGGLDALNDLESGRGVDPETFAGLYAGQAIDEVAQHLDHDEQGRLTYKGNVVRMYSISRLQQLFQERLKYSGDEDYQP